MNPNTNKERVEIARNKTFVEAIQAFDAGLAIRREIWGERLFQCGKSRIHGGREVYADEDGEDLYELATVTFHSYDFNACDWIIEVPDALQAQLKLQTSSSPCEECFFGTGGCPNNCEPGKCWTLENDVSKIDYKRRVAPKMRDNNRRR